MVAERICIVSSSARYSARLIDNVGITYQERVPNRQLRRSRSLQDSLYVHKSQQTVTVQNMATLS
eukprot:6189599-Pleurochrysis_carterae.AAC.2